MIDSLHICPHISESKRPQNEYSVGLNDGSKDGTKEGFLNGPHVRKGAGMLVGFAVGDDMCTLVGDTVGSDVGKESREKEY